MTQPRNLENREVQPQPTALDGRFLDGAAWGRPGAPVEHVETHAAHVFLCGDRAYKIKKPVKLPYLDFSSLERREAAIRHELAVNRPFAPSIYLAIDHVLGEPTLVMRRFGGNCLLSDIVKRGPLDDALALALAKTAAESHAVAGKRDAGGAAIMAGLGAQLAGAFAASRDLFPAADAAAFRSRYEANLLSLSPLLDRRAATGLVRRCHGDMHCGNIFVEDGQPVLFDAIEFSEKIATIDVLYDLAFLLMDLARHGQLRAANTVFNGYLDLRRKAEDLSGLAAMPLFLATRAGVRALVTADLVHELPSDQASGLRREALDYFETCRSTLAPATPALICIGGLSGTGKSTVAKAIAPAAAAPPGALIVRTDRERKHLAGVAETVRLSPEHYAPAASSLAYAAAMDRAGRALAAGHAVILDAVFSRPEEREAAEALARRCGASFAGFWLEAPAAALKSRVAVRKGDASDATPDVVDLQLSRDPGIIHWRRVDASGSVEAAPEAILKSRPA